VYGEVILSHLVVTETQDYTIQGDEAILSGHNSTQNEGTWIADARFSIFVSAGRLKACLSPCGIIVNKEKSIYTDVLHPSDGGFVITK
jgi:hypothetical protein